MHLVGYWVLMSISVTVLMIMGFLQTGSNCVRQPNMNTTHHTELQTQSSSSVDKTVSKFYVFFNCLIVCTTTRSRLKSTKLWHQILNWQQQHPSWHYLIFEAWATEKWKRLMGDDGRTKRTLERHYGSVVSFEVRQWGIVGERGQGALVPCSS